MSNKRKIKRSWNDGGNKSWRKDGEEVTRRCDELLSSDVNQVMVNSSELIRAFKGNLGALSEMSKMIEGDEEQIQFFMCQYNGAIMGMINMLCSLGVYSPAKMKEILDFFLHPEAFE